MGKFLDKVYDARDGGETKALYDEWAASYDAEVTENGYVTPDRCARALKAQGADLKAPILDFGCGTGLSGLALRLAGFERIDGVDLSREMLAEAEAKSVYRNLSLITAGDNPVRKPGTYNAIAAIGVIGAGAAPISVFDTLMKALGPGGKLVFSFNDHALADKANEGRLAEWMDCGAARLLHREYGPHLTKADLNANVYVVEKA
ncbi:MAG: methyltransferase domain-containing protein [Pseudomonadota bacterium]